MNHVERIICADWGKESKKRAAYEVILADRLVRRVTADVRDVGRLLTYAADGPPTLVAFDAPIGVPETFLRAVQKSTPSVRDFMSWVVDARLGHSATAQRWVVDAPFFAVPAGRGSLNQFVAAAGQQNVELRRRIEQQTKGKTVFITSGVPGSVGSAALDVWRGLVAARQGGTAFRVWPFEGSHDATVTTDGPVVAEIYPRAAYATALIDTAPRARLAVAKTDRATRFLAVEKLCNTTWARRAGVQFDDLDCARNNEDDFDALLTASALLRCVVEKLPLSAAPLHQPAIEGAMLGTGSIDLTLPEVIFR